MKNKELAQKIKTLRNANGYSQEELSEKSGLSLRTIQRIENGETEPRGDSVKRLAAVFNVLPNEIASLATEQNNGFMVGMNLSAISFLFFPLLGIFVPLIMWLSNKNKIQNLNKTAKSLFNFQITWILILSFGYMVIIVNSAFKMSNVVNAGIINTMLVSVAVFIALMYIYNLVMIIINTFRLYRGKTAMYFPAIKFLKP